jgi:hypothetical protein
VCLADLPIYHFDTYNISVRYIARIGFIESQGVTIRPDRSPWEKIVSVNGNRAAISLNSSSVVIAAACAVVVWRVTGLALAYSNGDPLFIKALLAIPWANRRVG